MRVSSGAVRLSVLGVTVLTLFSVLFVRLWFMQVLSTPDLEKRIVTLNIKEVYLLPPRGRILDRKGRVLADNIQDLTVVIDRKNLKKDSDRKMLFERLSAPLQKSVEEMEKRYQSGPYDRLLPLPLAEGISETLARGLLERIVDFEGLAIVESHDRAYRYSPTAGSIVGYTGKIQKESLDTYKAKGYQATDTVGVYGVEKAFEEELRGKPGRQKVEVNASNQVVRVIEKVEPEPGKDVQLTIDVQMQQYAEHIFHIELLKRRQERPSRDVSLITGHSEGEVKPLFKASDGALVVEDATNGEIIALVTDPSFDNRWYSEKTDGATLDTLFGSDKVADSIGIEREVPRNNAPLFQRAVSGTFAIGSTMKPFTAVAALKAGIIGSGTVFSDNGKWTMPDCKPVEEPTGCEKSNAGGAAYGSVNMSAALAVSSDAYFYDLGAKLWLDTEKNTDVLQKELRGFGFGEKLGVRFPGDQEGIIPDREVKKKLGERGVIDKFASRGYFTGDNVLLAIGQGLTAITPLQLVNGYAALANGGSVWRPRIAKAIYEPGTPDLTYGLADIEHAVVATLFEPEVINKVDLEEKYVAPVKDGMRRVLKDTINGQPATARDTFKDWNFEEFPLWGKTGTAQIDERDENDTSLFGSFGGPKDDPSKYAMVAIIEKGGFGGQAAAPVSKCMWQVLQNPSLLPEVSPIAPLDKTNVVPRAWNRPENFDGSCLLVDFSARTKER
jgi:penicillin-binding protein 2